ncbi:hypothetical protein G4B88_009671 [Cannabis sativa]|uniref:Uncharacterized protein n=1 Tax=Cannabis sativa TaxID=3483 RepID=A0A7J6FF86_CANSA|nr:hypothetical protein G4B88_009671 [Cannabis sativa]
MDQFFKFFLEDYRTHFVDGVYHDFSYLSGSASYSRVPIIPFSDVSNNCSKKKCDPPSRYR